jgi:lipopolysaccharide transport system ATP-binding protein
MAPSPDVAIAARGIGKEFRIGQMQAGYRLLSETITARLRGARPVESRGHFWALRDIDLDVRQGESIGLIGRNGAGKSTLLKVLARITPPTAGEIRLRGRVGALLEVGAGFHPELTGRENVYLNGIILGMNRAEIDRKFDEIVEFAGVEQFIDTPVKRYSSGMYLRLAFSVAAHLETEILVVDEVLAVGDAAFQRKCLGQMDDVAKEGRTIVFVSHNTAAVEKLCDTALVLENGRAVYRGPVHEAVETYMRDIVGQVATTSLAERTDRTGTGALRITSFRIEAPDGRPQLTARSGEDCVLVMGYESADGGDVRQVVASFAITDHAGTSLILHRTDFMHQDFDVVPGRGEIRCRVPQLPLAPASYSVGIHVEAGPHVADAIAHAAHIDVESGDFYGTGHPGMGNHSPFMVRGEWSVRRSDA